MTWRSQLLRTLPRIGSVWIAAAALHLVLRVVISTGGLPQPPLPLGYRAAAIATEWSLLAVAVALTALPLAALSAARNRPSKALRAAARGAQYVLWSTIFLGAAASWTSYAISGCFLDRAVMDFVRGNSSAVGAFLLRSHPVLSVGLPLLLVAAAVLLTERLPSWLGRLADVAGRRIGQAAIAGVVLSLGLAAGGEMARRGSERRIADPVLQKSLPLSDAYREYRSEQAGPLTHLLPWGTDPWYPFANESPFELHSLYCRSKNLPLGFSRGSLRPNRPPLQVDPVGRPPAMIRRPIVPMDQYCSTVDQSRMKRWNVILVILDSFRADSLQATGGTREIMPAVESLAREGAAFPDCYTPATHTDYAMPAAHSSHYPLRHPKVHLYPKLPRYPRVLIYDVLKALGWRTAMFSSGDDNWNTMANYYQTGGLETHFHAAAPGTLPEAEQVRSSKVGSLDDRVTVTEALKWIDGRGDGPFYLSLILQNCHLPFPVPDGFPRRFGPATLDFEITEAKFPVEKKEIAKEVFADSLAYVDSQLGRLIRHLKDRGEWDRTVIVVTGDHGEAFFEHGLPAHSNSVFEEAARVPLVIRAPGMARTADPRPAELIDIPPSLLHLLGLPPHPSFQGLNLFSPDPRPDRVRFVLLQTGWRNQIGVIQSGFKLIVDTGSNLHNLFDLKEDPGEKSDVSYVHPEIKRKLVGWMTSWLTAQLEYYNNIPWQTAEYPPLLREP